VHLHIGLDDTDSTNGGCTTYIAARLVERLNEVGTKFLDYPNIIRLNPNIPYKTRGNAAVALRLETRDDMYDSIMQVVLDEVEKEGRIGEENTDPAAVFLKGDPPRSVRKLARLALCDLVPVADALEIIRESSAEATSYGTNMGLVGALAAIGHTLEQDHTFEFIAYRRRENYGSQRLVDGESVKRMNRRTHPLTFNNYDDTNKRVLITPHGPDPVLLGIRGETSEIVRRAFHMLTIREPVERWVVFRTNHGTEAHLDAAKGNGVKVNAPVVVSGQVDDLPKRGIGGHAFFPIHTTQGEFTCAAYEPTGHLRDIIMQLIPGDQVTVYGGIPRRHGLTINLEKLEILTLRSRIFTQNPQCPRCGKRLKSAGSEKGFKCDRCALVVREQEKDQVRIARKLVPGLYLPESKAHRHLTKPLSRYGQEKNKWNHKAPSGEWHDP
jgi:tRNA(Ile2)-agmatinylcytidine synthase